MGATDLLNVIPLTALVWWQLAALLVQLQ